MARVAVPDPAALQTALQGSDPATAIAAATEAAELEQRAVTDIFVGIYDKFYNLVGECGDYIELSVSWPKNQPEPGTLQLKGTDPLVAVVLQAHETTVPVVVQAGHLRWSGRVDVWHDKFGENQADVVECELIGDGVWLSKILAWPNFLLPIQVQFPPRGLAIGGAITCIKWLIGTQTFRIQAGLWDLVNNLGNLNLDWRTWFGTALMQDIGGGIDLGDVMRMLRTPIYVIPTNPLTDTSPFTSINWRMDKVSEIIREVVEDNGLVVEVKLWLPGDPQPHDGMLFPLTSATIVVDVKDRMGVVGPTGTFLDGILRVLIDIEGSVFGKILEPVLNPGADYHPEGVNIAPLVGVNFVQPWCIFNADHPRGGVRGELVGHHPLAWRIVAGGKSPAWLNKLINATLSWILDMVLIVIGITGVPSNLLDGLFNDVLLAFNLADIMDRRIDLGPYGFPEFFVPTQHGAYNLDMVFTILRAVWETRGYVSGRVIFDQNYPYEVGRDVFPGALASIVRRGKLYTDYIENIVLTDNRSDRVKVEVQIGDNKAEDAPIAKVQRKLVKYEEAINILTLSIE